MYDVAADLYSVAIEIHPTAVLYGNRAQAYLKKELYGSALEDADNAIAIDPSYVKGFYRRATANMALGRFKKALTDYQAVVKVKIHFFWVLKSGKNGGLETIFHPV